jgi:hypothetical protein
MHLPPPVPKASAPSVPSTATVVELKALTGAAKDPSAALQDALDDVQQSLAAREAAAAIPSPTVASVATRDAPTGPPPGRRPAGASARSAERPVERFPRPRPTATTASRDRAGRAYGFALGRRDDRSAEQLPLNVGALHAGAHLCLARAGSVDLSTCRPARRALTNQGVGLHPLSGPRRRRQASGSMKTPRPVPGRPGSR